MRTLKISLLIAFSILFAVAAGVIDLAGAANANEQEPQKALATKAGYAGSDSCAECHTAEATHWALTAHAKTNLVNKDADKRGCEACHGPAQAHLDFYLQIQKLNEGGKEDEATTLMNDTAKAAAATMASFKGKSSAAISAVCLKCHEGSTGRTEERFNFRRSEHFRHGISCLDCHSSHEPQRTEFLLRGSEPNLCYQCHVDQKSQFAKPFHHKVPEGGMKCSDCHNQHGGFMAKSQRNSLTGDAACIRCHADKQGPFVYEHAPVKIEGCQTCHTPHGSTNPKLLTRNEVRFLCLECHSNTPGIVDPDGLGEGTPSSHDITTPRYRNCTACHYDIHGSNKNKSFR